MSLRDDELRYNIHSEPFIHMVLDKLMGDADSGVAPFNPEELTRAVWVWADEKVNAGSGLPTWFVRMLEQRQRQREADNIIEGDAGEG
jgi:hypothetical protein